MRCTHPVSPFWLASFGSERLEPPDRGEQTLVGERRLGPIQAIRNQETEAVHILRTRAATQAWNPTTVGWKTGRTKSFDAAVPTLIVIGNPQFVGWGHLFNHLLLLLLLHLHGGARMSVVTLLRTDTTPEPKCFHNRNEFKHMTNNYAWWTRMDYAWRTQMNLCI